MNQDTYFESGEAEEVVGRDQQWTFGGFLRGPVFATIQGEKKGSHQY